MCQEFAVESVTRKPLSWEMAECVVPWHLPQESKLAKARALSNTCQLLLLVIIYGEVAVFDDIEHIACAPLGCLIS